MIESFVDIIDRLLRALADRLYLVLGRRVRRISIGPVGLELRGPNATAYEQVLKKLEVAHQHLADVAGALDDLKLQYTTEMQRVDSLRVEVTTKKQEYADALGDLEMTRQMLAADQKRIRAALGIDDRRLKIIGFVSGVFASLAAALIWNVSPWLWGIVTRAVS